MKIREEPEESNDGQRDGSELEQVAPKKRITTRSVARATAISACLEGDIPGVGSSQVTVNEGTRDLLIGSEQADLHGRYQCRRWQCEILHLEQREMSSFLREIN